MTIYTVTAAMVEHYTLTIVAETREDAERIADEKDTDEWTQSPKINWEIIKVTEQV